MPRLIREEEFIDKIAAISDLRTLSLPTIGKVLYEPGEITSQEKLHMAVEEILR